MRLLRNFADIVEKYMALIIILLACLSLCFSNEFRVVKVAYVNYLLAIIMFCMGQTLKISDFRILILRPKEVLIGAVAQFTIMPLLALIISKAFNLSPDLTIGLVLVGTCPGGTASNIITYLSKGDVALSIGMTAFNTLLSPFLTPFITYLILHSMVKVDAYKMFESILLIVILPLFLGFIVNKFLHRLIDKILFLMPLASIIAISLIVIAVVSHNTEAIKQAGFLIFLVCILHNALGFLFGFLVAKLFSFPLSKTKALSIEVGMQNSGLATALAKSSFPNYSLATVPGAVFSIIHNVTGALLANVFKRM